MKSRLLMLIPIAFLSLSLSSAADSLDEPETGEYQPDSASEAPEATSNDQTQCQDYNPNRRAYFGDLHIHTRLSLDAEMQDTRTGPLDAYHFAQGMPLGIAPYDGEQPLRTVTPSRPLDFAAVTDHAEMLGETHICRTPGTPGHYSLMCIAYRLTPGWAGLIFARTASLAERHGFCGEGGEFCLEASRTPWEEIQSAAAAANKPCEFTSLIGYEWTGASFARDNLVANLHRNVIFRSQNVPSLPISFVEANRPELLWDELDRQCANGETDCDATVIPHNSNISLGEMYPAEPVPESMTLETYSQRRKHYESLVEMIQHKGSSECYFGADMLLQDEFCNFEQLPWNSFSGNTFDFWAQPSTRGDGYVREVLRDGLRLQKNQGGNPYKMGFIGSTDTHRSLSGGVDETPFSGHGGAGNSAPSELNKGLPDEWEFNPGGLAVLYAEENSRDALFDAMRRREAYATSGPRMQVRFFAGEELQPDLCNSDDYLDQAYANAVPMGGDLRLNENSNPQFLVSALKDSGAANRSAVDLQRIQIIKGWVDDQGQSREQIYEVAGSPNNGASVDTRTCEPQGKGHSSLCRVWQDPQFDKNQTAYYYARVLENPSCRWSTHVCNAQGVDCNDPSTYNDDNAICCSTELQKTIQERAWTSPIWLTPEL